MNETVAGAGTLTVDNARDLARLLPATDRDLVIRAVYVLALIRSLDGREAEATSDTQLLLEPDNSDFFVTLRLLSAYGGRLGSLSLAPKVREDLLEGIDADLALHGVSSSVAYRILNAILSS